MICGAATARRTGLNTGKSRSTERAGDRQKSAARGGGKPLGHAGL
jgi:hypothetical protein